MACYIYEANIISELAMRFEHNEMDEDFLVEAKDALLFSCEAKQYIDKILSQKT